MMLVPDERVALLAWVKSTSHSNVVIDDSVNALVSIKNLSIRQISVTALRLFCVHHQISGYKNKSKEVTCMLIIQWTMLSSLSTCILTVTHMPYFRDAFQSRIEIVKTHEGSQISI